MSDELIKVLALPSVLNPGDRIEIQAPLGSSIEDMISLAFPVVPIDQREQSIRVLINETLLEPALWRARPKAGTRVIIRAIPGNSAVLRNVLTIAVSVAAVALGQFYVGPTLAAGIWGTTATTAQIGFASGLSSAALCPSHTMIVDALACASGGRDTV